MVLEHFVADRCQQRRLYPIQTTRPIEVVVELSIRGVIDVVAKVVLGAENHVLERNNLFWMENLENEHGKGRTHNAPETFHVIRLR